MKHHVLDENTQEEQYPQLLQWKVPIAKVGVGFGWSGMQDEEILRELHRYRNITFHTQDADFYHPRERHKNYCLVYYAVKRKELATYVRRFLRQPQFNTQAKRMGKIIQVTPHQISVWALGQNSPEIVNWTSKV